MSLKSLDLRCHFLSLNRLSYAEVTKHPSLSYFKPPEFNFSSHYMSMLVSRDFCSLELFRDPFPSGRRLAFVSTKALEME